MPKPKNMKRLQRYIVFTFGEWQAGQAMGPYLDPSKHVICIREGLYQQAKCLGHLGVNEEQAEMYGLEHDKHETKHLAWPSYSRNKKQDMELSRLKNKLADVEATRSQPP